MNLARWLLPRSPDVLGLLRQQAQVTAKGTDAFAAWSASGSEEDATAVRAAEHEADEARRDVLDALRAALSTPIDQEDLYVLSERLDLVVNGAKNTVLEAEVLRWRPDEHAAAMARCLREGAAHLADALGNLHVDAQAAEAAADRATKACRNTEKAYRTAMSAAQDEPDLRSAFTAERMYQKYVAVAQAIDHEVHRLWFALLKDA